MIENRSTPTQQAPAWLRVGDNMVSREGVQLVLLSVLSFCVAFLMKWDEAGLPQRLWGPSHSCQSSTFCWHLLLPESIKRESSLWRSPTCVHKSPTAVLFLWPPYWWSWLTKTLEGISLPHTSAKSQLKEFRGYFFLMLKKHPTLSIPKPLHWAKLLALHCPHPTHKSQITEMPLCMP